MNTSIVGQPIDYIIILVYFVGILLFGSYFGRFTKSTKDFFFGGQRFAWWLIALSCIATTVGSYSFIKYSAAGFSYGLSSTMTYLNDWYLMPLFLLGWIPIIYFNKIVSVPEYFEKRFGRPTRVLSLLILMIYMVGYIGINFYTMAVAMKALLGWDIMVSSTLVALVCAIYVAWGGQTAVIMTDLLQGILLLIAGIALLFLGLQYVGGVEVFWKALPEAHQLPFAKFNEPPEFNFVGVFWQDGVANSIAFYFMNQGLLLRFLSVKSVRESKKVVVAVLLILMPLGAIATAGVGWIGKSMHTLGMIPSDTDPNTIFVVVSHLITTPGIFGLVMAALTAALMSTVDTLINAVSTVFVNDIWKPFVARERSDKHYLSVARWSSILTSLLGLSLVPVFAQFKSIYVAHATFVATVTPPMVVAILLGAFWKRYTAHGAFATLLLGSLLMILAMIFPQVVAPFSHGISPEGGFQYTRALYGIVGSGGVGIIVSLLTKPKEVEQQEGLMIHTVQAAKKFFKGGEPNEAIGEKVLGQPKIIDGENEIVSMTRTMMERLKAKVGDVVYCADSRWWFGGLRSVHAKIGAPHDREGVVHLSKNLFEEGHFVVDQNLLIEKII